MTSLFIYLPSSSWLIILVIKVFAFARADLELQQVNVVFRHGDRAPDNNGHEMYPNDPYVNCSFYPMGLGGLTNQGKRREYQLGTILRKRYEEFLGSVYIPDAIRARSTDYDRTKMSLQLVLSALYPPTTIQKWNAQLPWQPIPTSYKIAEDDILMIPEDCPQYLKEYNRVQALPEVQAKVAQFADLMADLTEKTGKPIHTTTDLYYLYHTFMAEWSMNLTLPEWAYDIFPYGELLDGTNLEYDIVSYNTLLKRLNGGMLVRKITEDVIAKSKDELPETRKMYLYSGHETNIAALQQALGVFEPHPPQYGSAVIVELLSSVESFYVRVLYYKGIPAELVVQKIPGCSALCPLSDFVDLLVDVIPSDDEIVCDKVGSNEQNVLPQGLLQYLINAIKNKIPS